MHCYGAYNFPISVKQKSLVMLPQKPLLKLWETLISFTLRAEEKFREQNQAQNQNPSSVEYNYPGKYQNVAF